MKNLKIAILYQANNPPLVDGIYKPMKPGGYSDSGADIAFALYKDSFPIITPVKFPNITVDMDWVFPDTEEGINHAINKGAELLWLNTVIYKGHPIEKFFSKNIGFIGQCPNRVDRYDNKIITNELLKDNGIPVPDFLLLNEVKKIKLNFNFSYPILLKPVRGRGSQGVIKINSGKELCECLQQNQKTYSEDHSFYIEKYLSGKELTITVMPPGKYRFGNQYKIMSDYWSLPPVRRFNHINGIAPYNGTVAVVKNSEVLNKDEIKNKKIKELFSHCEKAASLVKAKAPIRIDCRSDENSDYYLFDLNMKPNMTGNVRPHRKNQISLTGIAAQSIGWAYQDLLFNMMNQYWYANK